MNHSTDDATPPTVPSNPSFRADCTWDYCQEAPYGLLSHGESTVAYCREHLAGACDVFLRFGQSFSVERVPPTGVLVVDDTLSTAEADAVRRRFARRNFPSWPGPWYGSAGVPVETR